MPQKEKRTKSIFFTFDDGPGPKTREIAKLLRKNGVKATFFMTSKNIERFPEVVKAVHNMGHVIGVHPHINPKANHSTTENEIRRTVELIANITGKRPTLFRAAFGLLTPENLVVLNKEKLKYVDWSLDALDWKRAQAGKALEAGKIVYRAKKGDVVLFHDGATTTQRKQELRRGKNLLDALPVIIEGLKKRNFSFHPLENNIQRNHRLKHILRTKGKYVRARIKQAGNYLRRKI